MGKLVFLLNDSISVRVSPLLSLSRMWIKMLRILGHTSSQFITKCDDISEDLFWVYAMDAACQAVMLLMLEIKPSYPNSILAPASFI